MFPRLRDNSVGELGAILSDIREATASAAEIIDRLRSLARKRPMEPQPVDLNELVAGVMRLVSADALRRRVRVCMETTPGLPKIAADRISLQHVILNLVVNAMEAMDQINGHREVVLQTRLVSGGVEIGVCDSGPGIVPEMLPKIFDAFINHQAGRHRPRTLHCPIHCRGAPGIHHRKQRGRRRRQFCHLASGALRAP